MDFSQYITKSTFYWLSLLCLTPFLFIYYLKTIKDNREIYWYIYEDGERKFDYNFCRKVITQFFTKYFTFFTFMNVLYFAFAGKWISDTSFQTARGFMIIGAVTYVIDLIEKSSNVLHEQKQKKIKIGSNNVKKENGEKNKNS